MPSPRAETRLSGVIRAYRLCLALLLALPIAARAGQARAEMWDWEEDPNYQFRMWIDDGQEVVYGFYVIFNESDGDTRDLLDRYDQRYNNWARSMGFGLIGTRFAAPDGSEADTEQSATLIRALDAFAAMSGHPEVANAPLLVDGLSLGGHNSVKFAALYPERTIGYMGGAAGRVPEEVVNPDFARVPGVIYFGELDSDLQDALDKLDAYESLRATGVEMAYFIQWGFGHERGYADRMGWKILSDIVNLRYPLDQNPTQGPVQLIDVPESEGWLADPATFQSSFAQIEPYDGASAPRSKFWLPTRDAAFVYRAHATRDAALEFVQPSGPDGYTSVQPGDEVPIEVSTGGLSNVSMVEVFDGSESIAQLTAPPYQTSWTADGVGMHALVAIATLGDGSKRSGLTVPVMVLGFTHPGGGSTDPGGDGGDTGSDDGGAGDGGSDDGSGDNAADGGDDTGGDGDGGCACSSAGRSGGGPLGLALLAALAALATGQVRIRRGSRRS